MQQSFRESDIIARIGGDEFVVFMTGIAQTDAQTAIDRFRIQVNRHNQEANRGYEMTFCEGIISVEPYRHETIESLLCEADKLMYKKKKSNFLSLQT